MCLWKETQAFQSRFRTVMEPVWSLASVPWRDITPDNPTDDLQRDIAAKIPKI